MKKMLGSVGARHYDFNITKDQYVHMRVALISALKLMHSEEEWWGPRGMPNKPSVRAPLEVAWESFYNHLCFLMCKILAHRMQIRPVRDFFRL